MTVDKKMRHKIEFFEHEQIAGPGTFKFQFLSFTGPLNMMYLPPIPLMRPGVHRISFAGAGMRVNIEEHKMELFSGEFWQSNWDYGGCYLGRTRSEKNAG